MEYKEEDYLQLSGIQHFLFCRRQWALIHVEDQWAENLRTAEGRLMHKNVHNPGKRTLRGDVLTIRAVKVHCARLGLSGECDAVEFHRDPDGVPVLDMPGRWTPYPVEYKKGAPKSSDCDAAQLCAQAMCLEEMLCCEIHEGSLFYGETKRRQVVEFTSQLRDLVEDAAAQMHRYMETGYTPRAKRSVSCNACSLKDICLPQTAKWKSVQDYLKQESDIFLPGDDE